jgi:class 3 adenylate cyclase
MSELPSGVATFLLTDIEGSTRLLERHPEAMRDALVRYNDLLRDSIEAHHGHVFGSTGDSLSAVFAGAPDAVAAALAGLRVLRAEDWGEIGALRTKMALHTGEAVLVGGNYFGATLRERPSLICASLHPERRDVRYRRADDTG